MPSIPSEPHEAEAFGQTGVGQYVLPVLSCVSLVLLLLSLMMWWRSHHTVDEFRSEQPAGSWVIRSIYGRVLIIRDYRPRRIADLEGSWNYSGGPMQRVIRDAWQDSIWKRIGIQWRGEPLNPNLSGRGFWVRIRWPFIAAMTVVLPAARLAQVIRDRRRQGRVVSNCCPECGYDLRASPKYCPECGAPVRSNTAS